MATLNNVITNANGCVGIGTSSPAQLLELKKTTGSAIALLNYNDSVKFNINASSAGAGYVGMVTNHDLIFVTNDTERARLNTNGNIGIGTSSPAYKLEVLGLVNVVSAPGSYGAMFRARDSVTLGTESFGGVHFTSNPGTDYTIGKWTTAAGAGLLQIRDQSGNKFFTIDGAGNVGIGTTTLSSLLTLHGTYPQLVANNPSTGSGVVIQLKDNGRDAGFMGHSTTTARLQFGSRGIANTQMTLDYNGNLGIGTTSPTRKLHIDGGATTTVGIYIDANGISGTDIEQSSDAFRFQIRDNIPALFYTNNTERIRIASDGNVGIGTSSPVSKLHLDDATAPYITITRTGVPTWQLRNNFPVNQYGFSFNNTTAGTTPLFIGAGGNIGIGTSGPTNRLDVVGGSGTTFNMSNDGDSQRGGKLTFISSSATGRQFYVGTTSAIYNLVFGIDSVEKARIDTAGNVGIGTTSPSGILDIQSSNSGDQLVRNWNTNTSGTGKSILRIANSGNNAQGTQLQFTDLNYYVGTISSDRTNGMAFYVGQQATPLVSERMRIDISGNVGIGTTAPSYKFQVNGDQFGTSLKGGDLGAGSEVVRMIKYDNTYAMVVRGDGYVGIGTSSPSNKITIEADTSGAAFADNNVGQLVIRGATNTAKRLGLGIDTTNNIGVIQAQLYGSGNYPLVLNPAGGNVGIGTTSAASLLSVQGDINSNYNSSGTSRVWRTFATDHAAGNRGAIVLFGMYDGSPAGMSVVNAASSNPSYNSQYLTFLTHEGAVSADERMRITSLGSVGIGTTSPANLLHVAGTIRSSYFSTFYGMPETGLGLVATYGSFNQSITFASSNTNNRFRFYFDAYTSDLYVQNSTDAGSTINTRLFIKSDGNIGIGTSSPLARLHVTGSSSVPAAILMGNVGIGTTSFVYSNAARGDVEVYGSTDALISLRNATANSYIQKTGNDFYLNNGGAGFISITTNTSERMRITSDGNVGIGTSSPGEKLGILNGNIQLLATSGDPYIRLTDNGVRNWYLKVVDTSDYFEVGGTNATSLVVTGVGNVGIGTTSPNYKLDVQISSGPYNTSFYNTSTLTSSYNAILVRQASAGSATGYFGTGGSATGNPSFRNTFVVGTQSSNDFVINTTDTERIRITAGGNVGIGTTTPFGTAANRTVLSVNGTTDVSLNIGSGGSQRAYLYGVSTYAELGTIGSLPLTFAPNNSEKMRLNVDGNVGIGTTAPAYKLEVNGSLYATRLSGSAMFTTNGKGRFYGTASYALAAPAGSSLTGQTDSATPFETSLGYQAGNVNTGTGNTAIGYQALLNNTTGTGSIAIGYQALYTNTRGKRNIAIGYEALRTTQGSTDVYGDPIGDENVAIGYQAARAAFNINRVVAIGHRALAKNLAGGNVAIGWLAMESNVGTANSNSGVLNTAVGTMALSSNTSGNANSAFGYLALNSNTTGYENTAVGHRSMVYNTTGKNNCSFGSYALYYNQIANNNSAFGNFALYNNTAKNNSAFGYKALRFNTTGVNNCAFGSGSLYNNTSGTKNTTVGGNAGSTITTGTNLSVFGYNAQASTATATNEVTLGNSSVATLRCQVTTITALSDFRDKTDINNVEVGLSFVEKLRPVTFKWDKREWYTDGNRDGSKKDTITQIGFIAQELKALQESENATYLNLVYESNPDKLEATPGNLMIPLIKAVQELNAIVKQQRIEFDDKIAKQQLEIDYLKSKLNN